MTTQTQLLEPSIPPNLVTLTVEQYHRMLATGILADGEPVELLDGLIVRKDRGSGMTISPRHRLAISRLMRLAPRIEAFGAHLQLQGPLTIEPDQEPEPDGLIVRGRPEVYADRHPGAGDVSCAIEVSESSLESDRSTKQRIYARAGIPQYVLCNRRDDRIELYEKPRTSRGRYASMTELDQDAVLSIRLPDGGSLEVAAADLLP